GSATLAEEPVDVVQSRPGKHALVADPPKLCGQVSEQLDLELISRCEVAMATLGGKRPMGLPGPLQACLAQSRAHGDDSRAPLRIGMAGVNAAELIPLAPVVSPGGCLGVVDQSDLPQA